MEIAELFPVLLQTPSVKNDVILRLTEAFPPLVAPVVRSNRAAAYFEQFVHPANLDVLDEAKRRGLLTQTIAAELFARAMSQMPRLAVVGWFLRNWQFTPAQARAIAETAHTDDPDVIAQVVHQLPLDHFGHRRLLGQVWEAAAVVDRSLWQDTEETGIFAVDEKRFPLLFLFATSFYPAVITPTAGVSSFEADRYEKFFAVLGWFVRVYSRKYGWEEILDDIPQELVHERAKWQRFLRALALSSAPAATSRGAP